jgi:hypothetical protein
MFAQVLARRTGILVVGAAAELSRRAWNRHTAQADGAPLHCSPSSTPAEAEFNRSSSFSVPKNVDREPWRIRNSYPDLSGRVVSDAPWLEVDFRADPDAYIDCVKRYCLQGMTDVDFDVQRNNVVVVN